eukprot:Ihof_evm4s204 gene=Ihof_evmTU4s204
MNEDGMLELLLLGSGTSEGIPRVSCLVMGGCKVCTDAYRTDIRSPNYRRAPSLLVRYQTTPTSPKRNILIDCGKFFWQTALTWFPLHHVRTVDAVILTHNHCDASYGLDDLRDFSTSSYGRLPVFIRPIDRPILSSAFPYLFPNFKLGPGGGVAFLNFIDYEPKTSFEPIPGIQFTPLEVEHGATGCCGFRFGDISYVSDALHIPNKTLEIMAGSKILYLDMLRVAQEHTSHMILPQSIEVIKKLTPPPKKVYLIGMDHQ